MISESAWNMQISNDFSVEEYDPCEDSTSDVRDCESPKSVSSDTKRTNLGQDETPISRI